jgi:hypothetical protein
MQYWYAEQLSALQEDPLCCGIVGKPVTVRFTWIRSFDHPVSIRLERSTKGKWVLRTKVSDGVGGGNPGRLVTDTTREVADAEAAKILSKVALGSEYWAMPPVVDDAGGKDGAQWIVEVLDGKNYHFVDRWSAEGLIRELGMQFIDLSQHRLDPVY